MIYFDTETCGFHGPVVLIQYAEGEGKPVLHNVWKERAQDTLDLIEWMMDQDVVGFNLTFDHFHLQKIHAMLSMVDPDLIPQDHIHYMAEVEYHARLCEYCIKPKSALDLMLLSRKTKFQSLMSRKPVIIRRVPAVIADEVCQYLEDTIPIDDMYFSRKKKRSNRWRVADVEKRPDLKDIVLAFAPSTSLKALSEFVLNTHAIKFNEVDPPGKPNEVGYAPYAYALGKPGKWNKTWPVYMQQHVNHWAFNPLAIEYAELDVINTRALYHYFDDPETGDDDSELACMVGSCRWRGFPIDVAKLEKLRTEAIAKVKDVPTAPRHVKKWITSALTDELAIVLESTKRTVLEQLAEIYPNEEVGKRATMVLNARKALKEIEIYDKLILAGRFHPSFKVIGTKSSRMSGTDDLNPQGIKATSYVRECFTLADEGFQLTGGDFSAFEVVLAIAAYKDPALESDVKSGKKIHGLFGSVIYAPMTYEEILASAHTEDDKYTRSKSGVFAMLYGGDWTTLVKKLTVSEELAKKGYTLWGRKYPVWAKERQKIIDAFQSMKQVGGIGSRVVWAEPQDKIESLFGFPRYFTLENQICKALYHLANNPPKHWKGYNQKVVRRDREQTAVGAAQTALYASAFQLQAANTRAAANHVIQSSGATITKRLQRRIWDQQPCGKAPWQLLTMNIHDEVLVPCRPSLVPKLKEIVDEILTEFRGTVSLLDIEWKNDLKSWADK